MQPRKKCLGNVESNCPSIARQISTGNASTDFFVQGYTATVKI